MKEIPKFNPRSLITSKEDWRLPLTKHICRVGLTGGVAAGKSTVLQRWQQSGVTGIDADRLAHQALEPDTATWAAVVQEFGTGILNADNTVNRTKLAAIVFGDDERRQLLNDIIHPVVRHGWTTALARLDAAGQGGVAVVAIPLLYEVGAEKEFAVVVAVGCSDQTQKARLAAKGFTAAQILARVAAQWPMPLKMERADYVIWNDGTLRALHQQADIILQFIKETDHATRQTA